MDVTERNVEQGVSVTKRSVGQRCFRTSSLTDFVCDPTPQNPKVIERHVGYGLDVTDHHVGYGLDVTDRLAGYGLDVTDRHVGYGLDVTDRRVGYGKKKKLEVKKAG